MMKRPQLVPAGTLNRMLQAADESCNRGDFQQGIEILERASRLDPANWRIRLQLARAHGFNYDYAAAERCFEQAVRIAPDKLEALASAGRQSLDFPSHNKLAEQYYRRAVEQKSATPEHMLKLAGLCERLHRSDEASQLVDRALQLDGAFAPALLTKARLERQAGRLEQAEKVLRSLLPVADRDIQIRGGYELGGILDRQGRYDEAMSAILEAKRLLVPDAEPAFVLLKKYRIRYETMQANISAEALQHWRDVASEFQPPRRLALLCGHPRSGTTLLEQVLDSHPDIISAEETDLFIKHVYDPLQRMFPQQTDMVPLLQAAPIGALRQSRERYFQFVESFLGQPVGNRLLIDKNPAQNPFIPAYIRFFPEVKFLAALRDPRDVCLSCFMQFFPAFLIPNCAYMSLERTVEEYAARIGVWRTLAPLIKNPCLEVRYEDMVEDLESVARKTLDFLGVPWDARVLGFDEHARQKPVRSPTYADVTKPVYKGAVGRWRNYQKFLEPHLKKLEPFIKAFGYE
jgi:tetratricopeptide (TPR) repeat protein